jgi:hypothetical protein
MRKKNPPTHSAPCLRSQRDSFGAGEGAGAAQLILEWDGVKRRNTILTVKGSRN